MLRRLKKNASSFEEKCFVILVQTLRRFFKRIPYKKISLQRKKIISIITTNVILKFRTKF